MSKKILSFMILLVMVFLLSSCNRNDLNEELEMEIKQDYFQQYGFELNTSEFYGLYKGAAVFFIPGTSTVLTSVTISGLKFSYTSSFEILVWKDGFFYNLQNIETIFEEEILTQNDLKSIHIIHTRRN